MPLPDASPVLRHRFGVQPAAQMLGVTSGLVAGIGFGMLFLLTYGSPAAAVQKGGGPHGLTPGMSAQQVLNHFRGLSPAQRLALLKDLTPRLVSFEAVEKGDLRLTVVERGEVVAADTVDVANTVREPSKERGGIKIRWVIEDGSKVKKGDLLVKLDQTPLEEELKTQQITVDVAQARFNELDEEKRLLDLIDKTHRTAAKIQVLAAELELKKYDGKDEQMKQLLQLKVEHARQAEKLAELQSRRQTVKAEAARRESKWKLEHEQAKLKAIESEFARCAIHAPRDGVAVYYVSPQSRFGRGTVQAVIAPGEPVTYDQKLMQIASLKRFHIVTRVHESQISRLREGGGVTVRVDAFPRKPYEGRVADISPIASQLEWFASDVKVYPVRITLLGETPELRPGMSAEVSILVEEREDVLSIPADAVQPVGKKSAVFVKTEDGILEREIATGLKADGRVEVKTGLKKGEKVLDSPWRLALAVRVWLSERDNPPDAKQASGKAPAVVRVVSVKPGEDDAPRRSFFLKYGLTDADFEQLCRLPGVTSAVPVRAFPVEIRAGDRMVAARLVATTPEYAGVERLTTAAGRFLTEGDGKDAQAVVVLGAETAAQLFPSANPLGQSVTINQSLYKVVGVLDEQKQSGANTSAFIPLSTCRARFGEKIFVRQKGSRSGEIVALHEVLLTVRPAARAAVAEAARAVLGKMHGDKQDWKVEAPGSR